MDRLLEVYKGPSVWKVCGARDNIDSRWIVVERGNGDPSRITIVRDIGNTVRIAVVNSNGERRRLAVVRTMVVLGGSSSTVAALILEGATANSI
jgi:hypothetical protein